MGKELSRKQIIKLAESLGARGPLVMRGRVPEGPFEVLCSELVEGLLEQFPLAAFDMVCLLHDSWPKTGSALGGWWVGGIHLKRGDCSIEVSLKEDSSFVKVSFSYPRSLSLEDEAAELSGFGIGIKKEQSDDLEFDLSDPVSVGDIRRAVIRFCERALQPRVRL